MRALGWLRAESAIDAMVSEWSRPGIEDDDFLSPEIAQALAAIGPASYPAAAAVLADDARPGRVRLDAAQTLALLADRHPEIRGSCVSALVAQLDAHAMQDRDFNGLLVSALIDARAVEVAPQIERAFASGRVEETMAGDWEDVQIELGLKAAREHPRKPNEWTTMDAPDSLLPELPGQPFRAPAKIGRNDSCPCGSGKKYKKCCGA